jgi:primosomal protein N' (replication factor Y)
MRAQLEEIPIVLASATPAIETRVQVERGRYRHLELPERFGGARLPDIAAIDLRRHPPPAGRWLAPPLLAAVEANLARGEQTLLFLNRRGYAPLTLCRHCGTRIECPNCSAWLVEHRLARRLQCHHCGLVDAVPDTCPECDEADSLVACGPGVERIAEEVAALFPEARTLLVTSDTICSPAAAKTLVDAVLAREVDIIIGTQLVTKGYHFPELTLVGVVDADLALKGGDLRAGERSFQQISQVAGRAGRGEKPGRVIIQTHQPEAAVIAALVAGDAEGFYRAETDARREAAMPPFGRLAGIIISGPDERSVADTARALARAAPAGSDGLSIIGPAPAPLSLLRGRYRHRLLVHAARRVELQAIIGDWLARVEVPREVRVAVDIDPYNFV